MKCRDSVTLHYVYHISGRGGETRTHKPLILSQRGIPLPFTPPKGVL